MSEPVCVAITIDTEEDDWGSFAASGQSVRNIVLLPELQEIFDRLGARPTYFVNRPPLLEPDAVAALRTLSERDNVEIGAHCHPWNTPPDTGTGAGASMMLRFSYEQNHGMLQEIVDRLEQEIGVRPTSFRAGRWGFGPTVSRALASLGFTVDASVSPFVDWTAEGGPDYSEAPYLPYLFDPERPLQSAATGSMVELPTTIGYLAGRPRGSNRVRRRLEQSVLARLKVVGLLDRGGLLARRWLSPEASTLADILRLARGRVKEGARYLDFTFHSCTLLPGATPFVRSDDDKRRFLETIEGFLTYARESGYRFCTAGEVAQELLAPESPSGAA